MSHCADGVALTVGETYHGEINDAMLAGLLDVADRVEPAGWGEFYLDLTGLAPMRGGETALASAILPAIDTAPSGSRSRPPAWIPSKTQRQ